MRNLALDIMDAAVEYGDAVALRRRVDDVYMEMTYRQLAWNIDRCGGALVDLGLAVGDRVAIFSPNLPEWFVADYGTLSVGGVSVPIYATNTTDQAAAIVDDSGARIICAGTANELAIARELLKRCDALTTIIALAPGLEAEGDGVHTLAGLLEGEVAAATRAELATRRAAAGMDDLATIIYTSGTTGIPKGVMLRHRNFNNQFTTLDTRFEVGPHDRSLCFLPLSHVYERSWSAYTFLKGVENTVLSNPREVVEALATVRPTVMVSAPRLYEKANSAIMTRVEAAPPLRRKLFHWAIDVGHTYHTARYGGESPGLAVRLKYAVADRLVLTKVRNVMGGPKNFFSSGGAALARPVEEFFLSLGLLICQGYGLTETAPMLTANSPGAFRFGTVGKPVDEVEIRIGEEGEIQVKGPNVMDGYWNKPEATAEAFIDGWFRTGDVGHLDDDGYLVITDRIKDLIVTSGGKNVAPQRIEALIGRDHYIDQMAVVGDRQKFVSAIVVPAFAALQDFAEQKKLQFADHEELIRLPEVVELYANRIREAGRNLAPFEKVKRFTLVAKEFSQAAGEITPTLKVRRRVITKKYHDLIERMYRPEAGGSE
ncbi:long-chain fatty acid--CoA ligase [bacterium]|nr:MAG: long-chain fatty acid--CoA ligase [bacterium]